MKDQASRLRVLVSGEDLGLHIPQLCERFNESTRIIAVTSGKGGVGKTTVAVNLAMTLAELSNRVLLVDADLGLANVDVMLGIESKRHIGHLLSTNVTAEEIAVDGPLGIKVISGGSGLKELTDVSRRDRAVILRKLGMYCGNFDFVVVDTSPGIGRDVIDFLDWADDLLLVTTTEPTSIKDTYAAFKMITNEMPEKKVVIVVNSASPVQADRAVHALNQVFNKFLSRECVDWLEIEQDNLIGRAVHARKPFVQTYPKSPAAGCIWRLADQLVGV